MIMRGYKHMEMMKRGSKILPLPSDDLVMKLEKYCRVKLPDEFKQFIKEYNGYVPEKNVFVYKDEEYVVERFLCLLDSYKSDEKYGIYDIRVVLTQLDARITDDPDLVGANIIPIASLFAGDFVCLDFRDRGNYCVSIWFHEDSDDFSPVTIKIADSFTDFLSKLQ